MNTPENKNEGVMEPFAPTFTPTPPQVMDPSLPPNQNQWPDSASLSEKKIENSGKKKGADLLD
jgi:hypothetical protein